MSEIALGLHKRHSSGGSFRSDELGPPFPPSGLGVTDSGNMPSSVGSEGRTLSERVGTELLARQYSKASELALDLADLAVSLHGTRRRLAIVMCSDC